MAKRAPTLLYGDCPHLKKRFSVIVTYEETRIPGEAIPHYKVADMECDYSDECTQDKCPIVENAPKHPPGIGLG
ncbi:MAG TPA: hypothetical protein VGL27_13120 [Negativicutes bacterium]|jgi:hypothetical protein